MIAPPFPIPDVVTLAVPAFVVLILIETLVVRKTGKGDYETRDSAASLAMGFGNVIAGALTGGIYIGAAYSVYHFRLFDIGWTWPAVVLCFVAEDLAYYWFHRLSHERRFWWAAHVVHHSSQHYNLTTALRQTWTGAVSLSFATKLPLFWIGFPPEMVFLFSGVSLIYQFWIHTETIDRLPAWAEAVFNTPSHHRVHHAINPEYLDANYAGVLIIWDRLFGTFIPEDSARRPRYGIVTQLGTFNPFRIAFHEWIAIARDVWRNPSYALQYIFGPPGWSHDGARRTSAQIKAAAKRAVATPATPTMAE